MKRRLAALAMVGVLSVTALAGCGGSGGSSDSGSSDGGSKEASSGDVTVTLFNTKSEIQDKMVTMADEYSKNHDGVTVEVYYNSDPVVAHLSTKYASNDPYTISMVDPKDVYSLGEEHAADLSGEACAESTDYAIKVGDKVAGVPFCSEFRGIMYNGDAIKKITGEDFDPATVKTTKDFKALCDKLVEGGMAAPTAIMKEDWSLSAHYFAEIEEQQGDEKAVDDFAKNLVAGKVDLNADKKFTSMMDTFDVLMEYNYAKDAPTSAEREVSEQKLAEGEVAFMFGGTWDWDMIDDYSYTENIGMMPVPQDTDDGTNEKLVGGASKYFIVDSSDNTSEEQAKAAKDFLNWLLTDDEGVTFITDTCSLIPASKTEATLKSSMLGAAKKYSDDGAVIPNYNYNPDDMITSVGASMQKYLAGQVDRAGLAKEITDYFSKATLVEH